MSSLRKITAVIALLVAIYYLKFKPKPGKVVVTESGPVSGIISVSRDGREFYEWLGIPFATPPVGELRFANPKPVKPWDTIRDASAYGSWCAQTYFFVVIEIGHEDCLFLNIHVPKLGNSLKLPVMIYIHGGGFMAGNSQEYRPDYFMDHDVILVTINYRLGIFGFLSLGHESVSGNMGLKDQALAIQWIHKNIQAFGGDPDRITLFGESAGAASTHYQMLSSQTKGLINKAIAISGSAGSSWSFVPPGAAISKSKGIAEHFNCSADSPALMAQCLRQVPASELLYSIKEDMKDLFIFFPHRNGYMFTPTTEPEHSEAFLTEHPLQALEQGRAQNIPFLLGINADEGLISAFSFYTNPKNMQEFEDNWEERIIQICNLTMSNKSKVSNSIREFYFPPNKTMTYEDKLEAFKHLFGDCFFYFGVHTVAAIQRRFSPVYLFYFNIHGIVPSLTQGMTGYREIFHPLFDFVLSFAKMYAKEILLGIPREDVGVNHTDDLHLAFPYLIKTIRKGHEFYDLSKSWVKFLVDFAANEHVDFMGEKLRGLPEHGPLMYLEISKEPKLVSPAFVSRIKFLKSVEVK